MGNRPSRVPVPGVPPEHPDELEAAANALIGETFAEKAARMFPSTDTSSGSVQDVIRDEETRASFLELTTAHRAPKGIN